MQSIEGQKEMLIDVSMQIILHAGNARSLCNEAFEKIEEDDFLEAKRLLEEAHKEIKEAHLSQTTIIQDEARGIEYPHSLLFTHAQDTLMTIKSELMLSEKIINLYEKLDKKYNETRQ